MKVELSQANDLKLAVRTLYDTGHGKVLIELFENIAGKYKPNYDPNNSTSIILAMGRSETMQTIRNIDRLTAEQIVEYYEEGI